MNKIFENVKGIIFDLDGTLIDSLSIWSEIDDKFLGERGYTVPSDYAEKTAHLGFKKMAEYTINRFNLKEDVETVCKIWMDMAREAYMREVKTKEYVKDFLDMCKERGYKLAVASAGDYSLFVPCLKANGIYDYFDEFLTVKEIDSTKNEPKIYLELAKRMSLKPEEIIVFEDIACALNSAASANFKTICVFDKHNVEDHKNIKRVDMHINSFKELLD